MFNQFHPDDPVSTMFGPTASFQGTTLGQAIFEFGSTSAANVSSIELTPKLRRCFPYIIPSDILGMSLKIPSSSFLDNAHLSPTITRLTTPVEISQSAPNPTPNSSLRSTPMPSMSFANVGS